MSKNSLGWSLARGRQVMDSGFRRKDGAGASVARLSATEGMWLCPFAETAMSGMRTRRYHEHDTGASVEATAYLLIVQISEKPAGLHTNP